MIVVIVCFLLSSFEIGAGGEFQNEMFPFYATVEMDYSQEWRFVCAGTIIAPRWVLVAANCINPYHSQRVVIGVSTFNYSHEFHTQIDVKNAFKHPDYQGSNNYDFNIGLLELHEPLAEGSFRAALLQTYNANGTDQSGVVVGAMITSWWLQGISASILQSLELPILHTQQCRDLTIRSNLNISSMNRMICTAADDRGNLPFSAANYGLPLLKRTSSNHTDIFYIHGILIKVVEEQLEGAFAIYSNVSEYVEWISNVINAK